VKCGAQLIKHTLLLNVRKHSCVAVVVNNVVPKHRGCLILKAATNSEVLIN
jgi:hypothetical protein